MFNRDPALPPISYERVMGLSRQEIHRWDERDVIAYALSVGMADDPLDSRELAFVYEKQLQVLPTFPVVAAFHGGPLADIGFDYRYVLHGEHSVTLHRPFPASGTAVASSRIIGAWDKGPGRGAVFSQEKQLVLEDEQTPLATIITTTFARAEGGFGGPADGQPKPHAVPDRPADHSIDIPTLPKQALLYRLSGDDNPLHVDPEAARAAGYPAPILHGLCTYAICGRAVLATYCDYRPELIRHHQVRFASPVFPGETISVDLWRDGETVSFEAHVRARGVTVIRNGKTLLG